MNRRMLLKFIVQLTMDVVLSEIYFDYKMNFKHIVCFIKAISYFVLLRILCYVNLFLLLHCCIVALSTIQ